MVSVADSAVPEALRDIHYLHSAMNLSQMMRIFLFCAWVVEVVILSAIVQYLPPSE